MITRLDTHTHYHRGQFEKAHTLNPIIVAGFEALAAQPDKESHYFHGRYENIYIEPERFPALSPLLTAIKQTAGQILKIKQQDLKFGFWFNLMAPDQQTTSHSHDDDDEYLSCVYYLKVPQNSGNLILEPRQAEKITIIPREGDCIFFDPALIHEVSPNLSQQTRLSLAGNFGPKHSEL